jgi:adenylate cyclase, class 2
MSPLPNPNVPTAPFHSPLPTPHCLMQNIEIKARVPAIDRVRQIAAGLAARRLGVQHQIDTYFACPNGRLKLRQVDRLSAQLVWYARPDEQGPKSSQYVLVPVSNPETLKAALSAALGVRKVVEKNREIFLWQNVRIHLDEVSGLGTFLEFEAVLGPGVDEAMGRNQVAELMARFGLSDADLLAGSYADMVL